MSFAKLAIAVALAAYAAPVLAHMEITEPAPLRSKINPQYSGSPLIDYSYTSPLAKDGSQFPCKGYHVDIGTVSGSTATITAGQEMTVKMGGSATHNGGSCQFALSYDNAATFGVIHEVVGGCPMDSSYSFTVPAGVPAGKNVVFAWTWFNKSGNREMYMDCAAIDIDSSGSGLTVPRLFEANIFGEETCTTIEGQDVNFADPAPAMANCPADKLITKDKTVSFGAGGSAPAPEPTSAPEPTAAPEPTSAPEPEPTSAPEPAPEDPCPPEEEEPPVEEDPCPPEDTPTQAPPPSTPTSSQAPTSSAPPSTTPAPPPTSGGSCEAGAMQCSADGASWSLCANGAWVNMGAVAPGTTCSSGAMNVIKRSAKFLASHYRNKAI